RCFTEAKILKEGSTTLPAKKFASLIRELTSANVEITTNANEVTEIVAASSRFKLNGMGCNDFPPFPELSDSVEINIPQQQLKEMFFHTSFAVSREDDRYTMTGVFLQLDNGRVSLVGTDGKRLAKAHINTEADKSLSKNYIIPMRAVEAVLSNLKDDGEATLYLMPEKIAVKTENMVLVTKLLVGDFPDFNAVIPEKTDTVLSLHREELMSLLRQVSLFTAEASHSVRFSFGNGELKLSANTMEIGEGKVSMPVNYHGPQLDIAFNPMFFIDILRHSKAETVTMGLIDSFNPGAITGAGNLQNPIPETNPLFVLMPMRLSEV
ncbi:MAG: DNA polymerase III subunit beta, partial [Waddliaceae bacterium]